MSLTGKCKTEKFCAGHMRISSKYKIFV